MKPILAACALVLLGFLPGEDIKQFTDWSPPERLDELNSPYVDSCVAISKNGMNLIFSSTRQSPNNSSNRDLYASKRESRNGLWGTPTPLTVLNTPDWESCPALSIDEKWLYFTRPGSCGAEDIFVSHRQDRRNDSTGWEWEDPVHLGCEADGGINSAGRDLMPTFFENEDGEVVMYFISNRTGSQLMDIYQCKIEEDGSFGPVTQVAELNSAKNEMGPTVRRDGLEIIFLSARPYPGKVASSSNDFWSATRESTADPWSTPHVIASLGNPAWANGRIALSFDGTELYFASWKDDDSSWELYVAKRERLSEKKN